MIRSAGRGGLAFAVVLLIGVVFALVVVAISGLAAGRAKSVRSDWAESFGSFDEIMQRFPPHEANATALELERRAAALGVDLAPRFAERSPASPAAKQAFDELKKRVFRPYISGQLAKVRRGRLDAPPAALIAYALDYERELDDLLRLLEGGDIPLWESDLSRLSAAPLPNLPGQIDLHKLLISTALARLHAGDDAAALRSVLASWSLSSSLRDSPILISQLVHLSATRLQIGALRQVRDLPGEWVERLQKHDFRQSLLTGMRFEAWHWMYFDRMSGKPSSGIPWWHHLSSVIVVPYTRLCMADVSDRMLDQLDRLERMPVLCDRNPAEEGVDLNVQPARWNAFGDVVLPRLSDAVRRVSRLELDRELLLLAAEADAARRAAGTWPDRTGRPSIACPRDRWNYAVSARGLKIGLSREVAWPEQPGVILPQSIILD